MCYIHASRQKCFFIGNITVTFLKYIKNKSNIYYLLGTVSVLGDINGRVGIEKDFIVSDALDKELLDDIDFLEYEKDRLTEDLKSPNRFGCRILELGKSSGLIICNGRFDQDSSKITFSNKNGCSIIYYLLMSHDSLYNCIKNVIVCDFNTFSCHAPLHVEMYAPFNPLINGQCSCKDCMYTTYKWDKGYKDDVMSDLMVNTQKCEDLLVTMKE